MFSPLVLTVWILEVLMKTNARMVSVMVCWALAFAASLMGAETVPGPSKRLIACLVQVESRGDSRAIGDKHLKNKAYGPLQIRKPACDDVNKRFGKQYSPEQCLGNLELSTEIFHLYMKMYATEKRLGHVPTDEDCARIWNGGPNGYKKPETEAYWQKVLKEGL